MAGATRCSCIIRVTPEGITVLVEDQDCDAAVIHARTGK